MAAIDSTGITLEIKPFGAPSFYEVGEIVGIGGPETETTMIKASTLKSPEGWHEFIAGMTDGGEFSVDLNYNKELVEDWLAIINNRRAGAFDFRITIPDGTTIDTVFAGKCLVKTYKPFDAQLDAKVDARVTLKLTGPVQYTEGN